MTKLTNIISKYFLPIYMGLLGLISVGIFVFTINFAHLLSLLLVVYLFCAFSLILAAVYITWRWIGCNFNFTIGFLFKLAVIIIAIFFILKVVYFGTVSWFKINPGFLLDFINNNPEIGSRHMVSSMNAMPSLWNQLTHQQLPRTPLLAPNQTLNNLGPGTYRVTGGLVHVGFWGNGDRLRVLGITVDESERYLIDGYSIQNTQFNRNFASVLYELKEAGIHKYSYCIFGDPGHKGNFPGNLYIDYFNGYRASIGLGIAPLGEGAINKKLVDGLAR